MGHVSRVHWKMSELDMVGDCIEVQKLDSAEDLALGWH